MEQSTTLRLTAFDTLFFRESRPFESVGGSELSSVFPPPPRTVLGAIRTAIGDAMGVDWNTFQKQDSEENQSVREVIGYGDDLGALSLNGIWLSQLRDGEYVRLYPVPAYLLRKKEGNEATEFAHLRVGHSVNTHLGKVRLPELATGKMGFKPLDSEWVTAEGLSKILKGDANLSEDELVSASELFQSEARLGIARNNETRTVQEGLLYQSSHIRPKPTLSLEVEVAGIPDNFLNKPILRLGAEGRMAGLEVISDSSSLPEAPQFKEGVQGEGIILTFLSSTRFASGSWVLPGFIEPEQGDVKYWHGEVEGIELTLHAAVIGKALREGGWDMAQHKPRDMQSFISAGSSYYCELAVNNQRSLNDVIKALHGIRIGEDAQLGRGLVVCGLWKKSEFEKETIL